MGNPGTADTFSSVALAALGLLLVGGAMLFFWGWRGRRIGDEPHCRKCGYDLTGLGGGACPECGASGSGRDVVIGVRRRRPRLWGPGLVLLVVALGGFAWAGYLRAKGINWYTYWSTFALAYQVQADDPPAIDELVSRYKAGSVDHERLLRLVPTALARQVSNPPVRSNRAWTNLLGALELAGFLTLAEQEQFHDQMVHIELQCRPQVRASEQVEVFVQASTCGATGLTGSWSMSAPEVRVGDSTDVRLGPLGGSLGSGGGMGFGSYIPAHVLKPGTYTVELRGTKIFAQPAFTREIVLRRKLEILPAEAADTVRLVADAKLAQQFKEAITFTINSRPWGGPASSGMMYLAIDVHGRVPMDCAFKVLGRAQGREFDLGTLALHHAEKSESKSQQECRADLRGVDFVTPILRASAEAAKETTDIVEIWAGEVVFDPIPVNHGPEPNDSPNSNPTTAPV